MYSHTLNQHTIYASRRSREPRVAAAEFERRLAVRLDERRLARVREAALRAAALAAVVAAAPQRRQRPRPLARRAARRAAPPPDGVVARRRRRRCRGRSSATIRSSSVIAEADCDALVPVATEPPESRTTRRACRGDGTTGLLRLPHDGVVRKPRLAAAAEADRYDGAHGAHGGGGDGDVVDGRGEEHAGAHQRQRGVGKLSAFKPPGITCWAPSKNNQDALGTKDLPARNMSEIPGTTYLQGAPFARVGRLGARPHACQVIEPDIYLQESMNALRL